MRAPAARTIFFFLFNIKVMHGSNKMEISNLLKSDTEHNLPATGYLLTVTTRNVLEIENVIHFFVRMCQINWKTKFLQFVLQTSRFSVSIQTRGTYGTCRKEINVNGGGLPLRVVSRIFLTCIALRPNLSSVYFTVIIITSHDISCLPSHTHCII